MAKTMRAVDIDFVATAPQRATASVPIARPQAAVFAAIADDPAGWGAWFPGFSRTGRYLTPAPHTVGAQREMRLGISSFLETVIAWEAPRLWGFRLDRATLPGIRALAETYLLEPADSGCTLTWTVAADPAPGAALAGRAMPTLLPIMLRRVAKGLERHIPAG